MQLQYEHVQLGLTSLISKSYFHVILTVTSKGNSLALLQKNEVCIVYT